MIRTALHQRSYQWIGAAALVAVRDSTKSEIRVDGFACRNWVATLHPSILSVIGFGLAGALSGLMALFVLSFHQAQMVNWWDKLFPENWNYSRNRWQCSLSRRSFSCL
ncbi:hypothetical protein BQ8794_10193 [Mesorhizobium prunaredense]|uniref:Uncharacterized protein n=1 Tax=Mesorhizobium prunaredense TaxID=1631249 RepID=A0A1R3V346_9HYPH|nr:hypothetical protein BQ8794_10193 [Mesorhizobium prunaredense]